MLWVAAPYWARWGATGLDQRLCGTRDRGAPCIRAPGSRAPTANVCAVPTEVLRLIATVCRRISGSLRRPFPAQILSPRSPPRRVALSGPLSDRIVRHSLSGTSIHAATRCCPRLRTRKSGHSTGGTRCADKMLDRRRLIQAHRTQPGLPANRPVGTAPGDAFSDKLHPRPVLGWAL